MAPNGSEFSWVKGKAIGSGSFGTVHLATDTDTGAVFAVKSAHQGAPDVAFESLKNEADILASMSPSRHVIQCLGAEIVKDKDNGNKKEISMFMEYMEGGSLSEAVAAGFGGSLDEQAIRFYTREILHGLAYLHSNGIAHCDLKCKNILLGSGGSVKLADFGCARRLSSHHRFLGGTPPWMAPEVLLKNEGIIDPKSDIWSLGCTVIEMATGRPPWSGDVSSIEAMIVKIACSDVVPQFPKRLSKEGVDFLKICLQRDPQRRWSAEELLQNHPFVNSSPTLITKNKLQQQQIEEDAAAMDSPVSVLAFGCYPDSDTTDPESWTTEDEFEFVKKRIRTLDFASNCYDRCEKEENSRMLKWQLQDDSEFFGGSSMSGMSWITVR